MSRAASLCSNSVAQFTIVALSPKVLIGWGLNQLHPDAHPVPVLSLKKAAGRFRRLVLTQEHCLVRPAASAAEIRLVARLITTHVLILISVLVSIRPVISTVRVVAIPRIRIERFVLRYVPASLV